VRFISVLFVLGYAVTIQAIPLDLAADRECKGVWAKRGFSASTPDPGRRTLFEIEGEETYDAFYRRLQRSDCWKEWLVVIYMAADNNLSPFSYRDLWEMESIGSAASVDVVVFQDTEENSGSRYYHIAKRKHPLPIPKLGEADEEAYLKEHGPSLVKSPVVRRYDEMDSGDVRAAGDFLRWSFEKYPSRRVLLIGWSHGEGFDAADADPGRIRHAGKQGGFAFDFTSSSHMAVNRMARGLEQLIQTHRRGKPIDIAGSDACLNQQIEFGYEWRGLSEYVFGSSTVVQKKGFNYRVLLEWITKHPNFETRDLVSEIPLIYGRSVSKNANGPNSSYRDPNATMAVWTVDQLLPLKRSLEDLGGHLNAWMSAPTVTLEKIKRKSELKKVISKSLRLGSVSNDLLHFLMQLELWARERKDVEDKVRQEISLARENLARSVLQRFIGEKYREGLLQTSLGVAIWLPLQSAEFDEMFPKFSKSKFYAVENGTGLSPWADWIEALYK